VSFITFRAPLAEDAGMVYELWENEYYQTKE
jgi:hypothetical protein